jgi:hypothetical protein
MHDDSRKHLLVLTGALSSEVANHLEPNLHFK